MDYDYYYDESRTRFQVQSGQFTGPAEEEKKINRIEVGACIAFAVFLLGFAWNKEGWIQFLLLWLASAMVAGPFAPLSATGGYCRVGVGETLPADKEQEYLDNEKTSKRNSKQHRKLINGETLQQRTELLLQKKHDDDDGTNLDDDGKKPDDNDGGNKTSDNDDGGDDDDDDDDNDDGGGGDDDSDDQHDDGDDEILQMPSKQGAFLQKNASATANSTADGIRVTTEWTSADMDLLKKLMVKHPRGKLRRWEVIAEAFNGSHSVESIVRMSKALGERNKVDVDSYSQFLAKRKGAVKVIASPLSQRWDLDEASMGNNTPPKKSVLADQVKMEGNDDILNNDIPMSKGEVKRKKDWTETEDKALLNALKTFPKDIPMRWEKVALAVPGRTKSQCLRRFAELRESFRNKKLEKGSEVFGSD